jgi:hypothetical protein
VIAELTDFIFAAAEVRNDGTMICGATSPLLKILRACLREGGGFFEEFL